MSATIRQVIEDTYPLTQRKINQNNGEYSPRRACCIGAMLAHHFGVYDASVRDFLKGKKAFANALGGNTAQVIQMLRNAGAGQEPFGGDDWPIPHKNVWDRLMKVESFPPIKGEFFKDHDFYKESFEGLDLTASRFIYCVFTQANLKGAKLHNTVLHSSVMCKANFQEAHLIDVKFHGVSLRSSDFRGATIQDCDFTTTHSIEDAKFDDQHRYERFNNTFPKDDKS